MTDNIKIPLNPSSFEEEYLPEKHLRTDLRSHQTYGVYASLVSPLLVPDPDLYPLQTPRLFSKRVFRFLDCSLVVNIPELTDEETLEFVSDLEKKHNKTLVENSEQEIVPQTTQLTEKEEKLLKATQYLLHNELTCKEIARLTGLTKNQVSGLRARIRKDNPYIFPDMRGCRKKLDPQHILFIQNYVENHSGKLLTLREIKKELLANFPDLEDVSESTISRELNLHRYAHTKVATYPEKRNQEQVKADRVTVSRQLVYSLHENFEVIFINEISISLGSGAHYGWSNNGQKLSLSMPPKSHFYTVITAITASRVLGAQVVKGAVTAQDYMGFLCNLIKYNGLDKQQKGIVVFADNLRAPRADIVKLKMESCITLFCNASVSPMLNAIEEFFLKLKRSVSSNPNSTESELVLSVRIAINVFEAQKLSNYVCHVLSFVKESLQIEDLL